jgi:hypothetical protein
MKYHSPKDVLDAARSPAAPPEELAQLANSIYVFVRVAVAENPNTPIRTLLKLIPDKLSTKINWKTDEKGYLENEDKWEVLSGLLHNHNLPRELFIKIAEILKPALSEISPRDYYPNEIVQALAESNLAPPEALFVLSDSSIAPKHIRYRIANPKSIDVLLKQLTNDPSENVRKRALNALKKKTTGVESLPASES